MRYWFDTEFIYSARVADLKLISIGMVAEDGREYYGVSIDFDKNKCSDWVKRNVLPNEILLYGEPLFGTEENLAKDIIEFIGNDPKPEFWAYFNTIDWLFLSSMTGGYEGMPKRWPRVCHDLALLNYSDLPEPFKPQHNALVDARWTKHSYEIVTQGSING